MGDSLAKGLFWTMPGIDRFTLNGLKGADLIIFNLLVWANEKYPLSGYEIAQLTCFHHNTVYRSLTRLRENNLLECHRAKRGQKYQYTIKA